MLIVDDDRRLCNELVSCLEDEGYFAEAVFDGVKGEELVRVNHYDIILLDVKIPNANGLDILRKIKKIRPESSIILTTARPFIEKFIEDENASSLLAGFLEKPFSVTALLEKIKHL